MADNTQENQNPGDEEQNQDQNGEEAGEEAGENAGETLATPARTPARKLARTLARTPTATSSANPGPPSARNAKGAPLPGPQARTGRTKRKRQNGSPPGQRRIIPWTIQWTIQ